MLGGIRVKQSAKSPPKKAASKSQFILIRLFMDRVYRNPYNWDLFKGVTFFAGSIYVAKVLCDLDILPVDPAGSTPSTPAIA